MKPVFTELSEECGFSRSSIEAARSRNTSSDSLSISGDAHVNMHVLGSGSKGNATLIEDAATGRALVIDCGICKRDFIAGCEEVGVDVTRIEAILITHEHTDHTKGLGVVTRGLAKQDLHPILYSGHSTKRESSELLSVRENCDIHCFECGDALSIAGLEVVPFATSHDASESFGFRIVHGSGDAVGFMTDTGIVLPEAFETLADCRILALEGNHDSRMLETGPYPYMLKKRVASDQGHLSNEQAAETLEALLSARLEQVVAMHISENNNTYRLPQEAFEEVIARNNHHASVCVAYQRRVVSV